MVRALSDSKTTTSKREQGLIMDTSEIATKGDIQRLRQEFKKDKHDLMRAIEQIGRPAYMTTSEVAEELQVCSKTALKKIKQMYSEGKIEDVDFDTNPIKVNRKQFFEGINS